MSFSVIENDIFITLVNISGFFATSLEVRVKISTKSDADPIHLSDLNDKLVPQTSMGRYHHYVPIMSLLIIAISLPFHHTYPLLQYFQLHFLSDAILGSARWIPSLCSCNRHWCVRCYDFVDIINVALLSWIVMKYNSK